MTWKITRYMPQREYLTDEVWRDGERIYRRTFSLVHPSELTAATNYNVITTNVGVGTILRSVIHWAGVASNSGDLRTIDVIRDSATQIRIVPSRNLSVGLNRLKLTIWYTRQVLQNVWDWPA